MKLKGFASIVYQIIDSALLHNRREIGVAVMCIITAIFFWFLYALNRDYNARITYPIHFQYDSTHYALLSEMPKEVDLQVFGNGWKILAKQLRYKTSPIVYHISSERYITPHKIQPLASKTLSGLKVQIVSEDTIHVHFERIRRKKAIK
jgi:hypothetical protein